MEAIKVGDVVTLLDGTMRHVVTTVYPFGTSYYGGAWIAVSGRAVRCLKSCRIRATPNGSELVMLTNYDSYDATRGYIVTTNVHALDPVDMYRRLAAEFNLDPFDVMIDAAIVIRANGYDMMFRESDGLSVIHPGALEHVEAVLYNEYLTASLR